MTARFVIFTLFALPSAKLEQEPERELNLALSCSGDAVRSDRARDRAERSLAEIAVRNVEVRRVGQIIDFGPELDSLLLADGEVLEDREVIIDQVRSP